MATYLATMAIGKYTIMSHRDNGIRFLDAIATDLFLPPFQPVDGVAMAISGQDDASYKRITRALTIPASGALLTF